MSERAATINELLARLNPLLFGEHARLSLYYAHFDELHEQDINANVMPTGMFNQLAANVSQHKALESVPLCATREETPDKIEVVSGHHRIRAGRQAGLDGTVVLLYRGLTNSEIRAKQLAHNAIAGSSDPEIIKQLYAQIEDVQEKMESYIDPTIFDAIPVKVEFAPLGIDPLADAKTVTVVFLPTQLADFQTALDLLTDQPDVVYLASREAFDGFREAVNTVKAELEIVSYPTAFAAMARMALERLAQMKEAHAHEVERATLNGQDAPPLPLPSVKLDDDLLRALLGDKES